MASPGSVGELMFAGQVMTGASTSDTVTVNVQVAEFPLPSVAVYTTAVLPTLKAWGDVTAGLEERLGELPELSLVVGRLHVVLAEGCPASLFKAWLGGQVITGASRSETVTWKLHVKTLFEESLTVYVTVVVPIVKLLPRAGTATTVIPPGTLSVATGRVQETTAVGMPGSVSTRSPGPPMFPGQVNVGGSMSLTITLKEQVAWFNEAS
mmetsp:Transcript_85585/g.149456  ORF Transcript_85585/g.149456 Transcript_85585/m.149456 type:complete len:209 (-) Transcript_85585:672-1298(-)